MLTILSNQNKEKFKTLPEDDLILLHFSLGKDIRNAFELYDDNTALLKGKYADDVSMEIIEAIWEKLKVYCRQ